MAAWQRSMAPRRSHADRQESCTCVLNQYDSDDDDVVMHEPDCTFLLDDLSSDSLFLCSPDQILTDQDESAARPADLPAGRPARRPARSLAEAAAALPAECPAELRPAGRPARRPAEPRSPPPPLQDDSDLDLRIRLIHRKNARWLQRFKEVEEDKRWAEQMAAAMPPDSVRLVAVSRSRRVSFSDRWKSLTVTIGNERVQWRRRRRRMRSSVRRVRFTQQAPPRRSRTVRFSRDGRSPAG